jgi:multiple sugar transport system permease protein
MSAKRQRPAGSTEREAGRTAFIFSSPSVLVMMVTIIFPFGYAIAMSFQRYTLTIPEHPFIGVGNYSKVLGSSDFWRSLGTTATFAGISVMSVILLGFLVALLLNHPSPLRGLLRAIVLIPWAVPPVVNGLIWKWMLDPRYGVLNRIALDLGLIDSYQAWLTKMPSAFAWVVVAYVWAQIPLASLLILAGLQTIPKALYEAAEVDGASLARRLFAVTIPSVRPVLVVLLIFETVSALKAFDIIYVLTGGGPGDSTTVLGWKIYSTTFQQLDFGQGSALAIIMALLTLSLSVFFFRAMGKGQEV